MKIKLISKPAPLYLCYSAQIPKTLIKKGFGLTFLNNFEDFDGLLIENCKIIHSFFMRFSFDVLFLNSDYKVIAMYPDFKPFRISKHHKKTKYVLELPSGTIKRYKINLSEQLKFEEEAAAYLRQPRPVKCITFQQSQQKHLLFLLLL